MKMLKEDKKTTKKPQATVFEGYRTFRTGTCITARKNILTKASFLTGRYTTLRLLSQMSCSNLNGFLHLI